MSSLLTIISLFCFMTYVKCNNVIGCGGFVKVDLKGFPYRKLSAHLTFLDGTVNYVTDILPNGAYSVPIYDSGVYVIKVVGPQGWSIEPVDGYKIVINNQETCGEDYNFHFSGFTVTGKVLTANINHGPSGIFINLVNNLSVIAEATTIDGGDFTIDKVMPGNFSLHLKSETVDGILLEFNDTNYNFQVIDDNVYIKESFIISGFPVFGDVKFNNQPIENVEFVIFSKSLHNKSFNFAKYKCITIDKKHLSIEGYNSLCTSISNFKGEFIFPLLPGGKYILIAVYNSSISVYDIYPNKYEFEIISAPVDLRNIFKITGFSVIGKVINFDASPISNAEIYIDGNYQTKSNLQGNFTIKGATSGHHEISVLLKGYIFNKNNISFETKYPFIGEFSPVKIGICGSISIGISKSAENEINEFSYRHKVMLINASNGETVDSMFTQISNLDDIDKIDKLKQNAISTFCFYANPGLYIVKPIIDHLINDISLAPKEIKILLTTSPLNLKFSPFRGTISGNVKCIEKCNTGEFEVTLKSGNGNSEIIPLTQHVSISKELSNEGYFLFKNIIPGNYEIELISANNQLPLNENRWCWSKTLYLVDILDKNIDYLSFEQIGFSVPLQSSHNITIDFYHIEFEKVLVKSQFILQGIFQVCLPKPGKYKLQVNTCHKLDNESFFLDVNHICTKPFDFRNPRCHIKINVAELKLKVNYKLIGDLSLVNVKELSNDVKGILKYDHDIVMKNITWHNNKGYLDFWAKPDSVIRVSVNSSKYLSKPENIHFHLSQHSSECLTDIGTINLELGTFLNGTVSPPLEGVKVEIRKQISSPDEDDIESIIAYSETNVNGEFSIGPLNSSFKYDINLSKDGFKIVQSIISTNYFQFNAYKLSELIVEVIDNITGKSLPGILLSIIGDDLRRNELTNEYGRFTFVGLTPGIYYLRAMMKELEFIPHGAVEFVIVEGSFEKILIKASRTSFSLHGKVVSLNGEPEAGVIIEGHHIKDFVNTENAISCKKHLARNEHATTDETGTFRMRGLQPGCFYKLSLKSTNLKEQTTIIRSYPNNINIMMPNKDVQNIKICALGNIYIREISAIVRSHLDIYLNSLSLMVFPSDNPDNVIAAHKFTSEGIFFQLTVPFISKKLEYIVRLQSNLNPAIYINISAQERIVAIEADSKISVYKHLEFEFYPVKKSIADSDTSMNLSSSLMLLFLILILSTIFFKKDFFEHLIFKCFKSIKLSFQNASKHSNITSPGTGLKSNILNANEIIELNNAIAKPKQVSTASLVKKTSMWSRPKKV